MNSIPRNILSGLLAVLFVVASITGVMMYFKIRILSAEAVHIWIGFAFVILSALHLVKNWTGFVSYFKKRSTISAMVVGVCMVLAFVLPPLFSTKAEVINPKAKVFGTMMNAPLSKVTTFVGIEYSEALSSLKNAKIDAKDGQSAKEIGKANNKSADEVLQVVFSTLK